MTHSYLDTYSQDLRTRMQAIRNELPEDVQQVRDEVNNLTDWKHYVRSYPQFVLPAVAVAAYAMVPHSRQPKPTSSSVVRNQHKSEEQREKEHVEDLQQTSIWAGLTSAVFTMATRSALSVATKYGSQYLANQFSSGSLFGDQPSGSAASSNDQFASQTREDQRTRQ